MADLSDLKLRNAPGETLSNYSLIEQHAQALEAMNNNIDSEYADKDTSTTTASTSYEAMANMTRTPAAGTYLVQFSTSVSNSTNTTEVTCALALAGTVVAASARPVSTTALGVKYGVPTCFAKITVNGTQAITAQWKTSGGTATAYQRQMFLTRVGA